MKVPPTYKSAWFVVGTKSVRTPQLIELKQDPPVWATIVFVHAVPTDDHEPDPMLSLGVHCATAPSPVEIASPNVSPVPVVAPKTIEVAEPITRTAMDVTEGATWPAVQHTTDGEPIDSQCALSMFQRATLRVLLMALPFASGTLSKRPPT